MKALDTREDWRTPSPRRRLRIYAHRGACLKAPENTIEAFSMALADGATALEMDIHVTRDGQFVVFHDADGRRVAGWGHRIRDLELDEIKGLHLDKRKVYSSIPTLREVLEEFPGIPMSVDLKPARPSLVPALITLIEEQHASPHVTIASFHDRVLHRVRRLRYRGRTSLTRFEVSLLKLSPSTALVRRLIRGQAAQMPRNFAGLRLDDDRTLSRCQALGLRADYWVVNDPDEARQLVRRGATGIMTDDPAGIVGALSKDLT